MSAVSIKICGLKTVSTAQSVLHLPIDHIGFMFAESKRQVTAEEAAEMIKVLQTTVAPQGEVHQAVVGRGDFVRRNMSGTTATGKLLQAVGVFVNPTMEELQSVLRVAPLDIIQLHGQESPEFCRRVREQLQLPIFKVMPIFPASAIGRVGVEGIPTDPSTDTDATRSLRNISAVMDPYAPWVEAILLDTLDSRVAGGSGKTFDWTQIPPYLEWARAKGVQLIIAGGLDVDNVRTLIEQYHPDGVDISSGVETDGVKDIEKIEKFVQRVRGK